MSYIIKTNGERVMLSVLVNADPSIVGLKYRNTQIVSMTVKEYSDILFGAGQDIFLVSFINCIMKNYISPDENSTLIILETVLDDSNHDIFPEFFCEYLRLYKAEDIYICFFLSYSYKDGKLTGGGVPIQSVRPHGIGLFIHSYSMTQDERKDFPTWLDKNKSIIDSNQNNKRYQSMINTYLMSYNLGHADMEYIMLFSILESLFSANSEITYQISRGVGILLSSNPEDFYIIYSKMRSLYTARSKYVHLNKEIEKENLVQLRDMVRKIIFRLNEIGLTSDEQIKLLPNKIMVAGYGVLE